MSIAYDRALELADAVVAAKGHDALRAPRAVQVVYLVGKLDFETTTGGVLQWLTNDSGLCATETVAALTEIGAVQCAGIVNRILAFFPSGAPSRDRTDRAAEVQRLLPVAKAAWRELGNSLLDWPDDVDALLRDYVERNAAAFVVATS